MLILSFFFSLIFFFFTIISSDFSLVGWCEGAEWGKGEVAISLCRDFLFSLNKY